MLCLFERISNFFLPPLIIAEVGINHGGSIDKAFKLIDDAKEAGCECVKFQCHIIEEEMIENNVVPGNSTETIWEIIKKSSLSFPEEIQIKEYVESKGMIFLSTPFSKAAANRLYNMGVEAFKIGSGECNNYPLIKHIAKLGKPVVLSTGMNSLDNINKSVSILKQYNINYALMHCTSIYPTPPEKVRLKAITELREKFPKVPIGLSDHSLTNFPCLAAVALGARVLERHFVSDKSWPGPDVSISMNPEGLKELIEGVNIIHKSLEGKKEILKEEQPTINFAYSSVVSIKKIQKGEVFSEENIWVKRPGDGDFLAENYEALLGKKAKFDIEKNAQIRKKDVL